MEISGDLNQCSQLYALGPLGGDPLPAHALSGMSSDWERFHVYARRIRFICMTECHRDTDPLLAVLEMLTVAKLLEIE